MPQPRMDFNPEKASLLLPTCSPDRQAGFGSATLSAAGWASGKVSVGIYLLPLSYLVISYSFKTHCWEMPGALFTHTMALLLPGLLEGIHCLFLQPYSRASTFVGTQ